jgi:hypothetical protein
MLSIYSSTINKIHYWRNLFETGVTCWHTKCISVYNFVTPILPHVHTRRRRRRRQTSVLPPSDQSIDG